MSTMKHAVDTNRTILWAVAFILGAMVILQAGRLPGNPAYAGDSSVLSNYSVVTADSGRGDDAAPDEIVYVIDNASGIIVLYYVDGNTSSITPLDGGSLPLLFFNALKR